MKKFNKCDEWIYESKDLKILRRKDVLKITNKKAGEQMDILGNWETAEKILKNELKEAQKRVKYYKDIEQGKKKKAHTKEIKYNFNADIEKKQLTIFDFL